MKLSRKLPITEFCDEAQQRQTLALIAGFYNEYKMGYQGNEGYRKSTDLEKLGRCVQTLTNKGIVDTLSTVFADLGCADGRVNVLMSYFVKQSIGIEIDQDILEEYMPRKRELLTHIKQADLPLPPENISLFLGSSLEASTYQHIFKETAVNFSDIDLFYTYITLHDLFAEKIVREAKAGALFLVYGFHKVLPRYPGLEIEDPDLGRQGIASLYIKDGPKS